MTDDAHICSSDHILLAFLPPTTHGVAGDRGWWVGETAGRHAADMYQICVDPFVDWAGGAQNVPATFGGRSQRPTRGAACVTWAAGRRGSPSAASGTSVRQEVGGWNVQLPGSHTAVFDLARLFALLVSRVCVWWDIPCWRGTVGRLSSTASRPGSCACVLSSVGVCHRRGPHLRSCVLDVTDGSLSSEKFSLSTAVSSLRVPFWPKWRHRDFEGIGQFGRNRTAGYA